MYAELNEFTERYMMLMNDSDRSKWTSTHHYTWQFLQNLHVKISNEDNLYKLNREIGYVTRLLIELDYTSVSAERREYQRLIRPLEGGERYD